MSGRRGSFGEILAAVVLFLILIAGAICVWQYWDKIIGLFQPDDEPPAGEENGDVDLQFDKSRLVFGQRTMSCEEVMVIVQEADYVR